MSSELTVSYTQPWSSDIAAGTDNTTDYLDNALEHFDDLSSQVKCRLLLGLVRRGVGEGEEERDRVNTLIDRAKRDDNHWVSATSGILRWYLPPTHHGHDPTPAVNDVAESLNKVKSKVLSVSTPVLVTADTLPLECCYLHPSLVPSYSIPPMKDYVKRVEVKVPPPSEIPALLPTNKSSNPLLGGSKPAPPLASKSVTSSAMSSSHAKSSSGGGAVSSAGKLQGGHSVAGKTYSHIPAVSDRRSASSEPSSSSAPAPAPAPVHNYPKRQRTAAGPATFPPAHPPLPTIKITLPKRPPVANPVVVAPAPPPEQVAPVVPSPSTSVYTPAPVPAPAPKAKSKAAAVKESKKSKPIPPAAAAISQPAPSVAAPLATPTSAPVVVASAAFTPEVVAAPALVAVTPSVDLATGGTAKPILRTEEDIKSDFDKILSSFDSTCATEKNRSIIMDFVSGKPPSNPEKLTGEKKDELVVVARKNPVIDPATGNTVVTQKGEEYDLTRVYLNYTSCKWQFKSAKAYQPIKKK